MALLKRTPDLALERPLRSSGLILPVSRSFCILEMISVLYSLRSKHVNVEPPTAMERGEGGGGGGGGEGDGFSGPG